MTRQLLLLGLSIGLWAFIIYIRWVATREDILFIVRWQIDKVAHLGGGLFLALVWEWKLGRRFLPAFLVLFFAATVGWEVIELLFDAQTQEFYALTPDLWWLDSAGDVAAALLGGYGYWVFLMDRPANPSRR